MQLFWKEEHMFIFYSITKKNQYLCFAMRSGIQNLALCCNNNDLQIAYFETPITSTSFFGFSKTLHQHSTCNKTMWALLMAML
jgi:hypothetical protein